MIQHMFVFSWVTLTYKDKKGYGEMTIRPGDPTKGQVQSMQHHIMTLQATIKSLAH